MSVLVEDEAMIVDAFACGNQARFINHSCTPNSEVRTLTTLSPAGNTEIVQAIYALRGIAAGEQVCIDYAWCADGTNDQCVGDVQAAGLALYTEDRPVLEEALAS